MTITIITSISFIWITLTSAVFYLLIVIKWAK